MQTITINGTGYPVAFGMRSVMGLAKATDGQSVDYDACLDIFAEALSKGAKRSGKTFDKDAEWIDEQIDENPDLFTEFMAAFEKSKVATHFAAKAEAPGK